MSRKLQPPREQFKAHGVLRHCGTSAQEKVNAPGRTSRRMHWWLLPECSTRSWQATVDRLDGSVNAFWEVGFYADSCVNWVRQESYGYPRLVRRRRVRSDSGDKTIGENDEMLDPQTVCSQYYALPIYSRERGMRRGTPALYPIGDSKLIPIHLPTDEQAEHHWPGVLPKSTHSRGPHAHKATGVSNTTLPPPDGSSSAPASQQVQSH
ncbi:hypothetical protein GGR55DRAFT_681619 [Xylaria sp. FL0064]|nr:hypothetical protein GGR55DRAFT_681619 [Xylaria sp. FL0064]